MSTPDTSGTAQKNTTDLIIISDAVCTLAVVAQHDMTTIASIQQNKKCAQNNQSKHSISE